MKIQIFTDGERTLEVGGGHKCSLTQFRRQFKDLDPVFDNREAIAAGIAITAYNCREFNFLQIQNRANKINSVLTRRGFPAANGVLSFVWDTAWIRDINQNRMLNEHLVSSHKKTAG